MNYPSNVVAVLGFFITDVVIDGLGAVSALLRAPGVPVLTELEHAVNVRLLVDEREDHLIGVLLAALLGGGLFFLVVGLLGRFGMLALNLKERQQGGLVLLMLPGLGARLFLLQLRVVLLRMHDHFDFNGGGDVQ